MRFLPAAPGGSAGEARGTRRTANKLGPNLDPLHPLGHHNASPMRRIHALPQSRPLCVTQQRASRQHPPRLTSALVGVLLCALWGLARAALPAIEVGAGFERMDLQPLVELMTGGEAGLTAEQARDHPGFLPNARGVNSLGFTTAPLWVRFRLGALPGGPRAVLLELAYPLLDEVTLDLFYPDGRRQTFESGDTQPFASRPLHFTNPTFLVRVPSEGTVVGLLRLRTTGSLQFPLVLRSPTGQSRYSAVRHLAFGLYYGAFVSLALLAGVIFLYSRDSTFLLYALYLSSFGLLQFSLNGFSHQFLWTGSGLTASRMPIVLIGTTMIFMMLLTIRFLGFWSHSRPLRLAFRIFLGLAVAVMLLGAFGPLVVAIPVASAVGTLLLPLILAAGASSLRRGVQDGALLHHRLGPVPVRRVHLWTHHRRGPAQRLLHHLCDADRLGAGDLGPGPGAPGSGALPAGTEGCRRRLGQPLPQATERRPGAEGRRAHPGPGGDQRPPRRPGPARQPHRSVQSPHGSGADRRPTRGGRASSRCRWPSSCWTSTTSSRSTTVSAT